MAAVLSEFARYAAGDGLPPEPDQIQPWYHMRASHWLYPGL